MVALLGVGIMFPLVLPPADELDAALKAWSELNVSAILAGAVSGAVPLSAAVLLPFACVVCTVGLDLGLTGTSSPAIALNLLGKGALGSSVYSGKGRKLPLLSTLTRSWFLSSSA